MGRTTPTITQVIHQLEGRVFGQFIKTARPHERQIVRALFAKARSHIASISMAGHLLPFETTLLAMIFEQQKQIITLEKKKKSNQK